MSSAVTITFDQPVEGAEWLAFCARYRLVYVPAVGGRNAFYAQSFPSPIQTQVTFGEACFDEAPRDQDGRINWAQIAPPERALRVEVSTFFGGAFLPAVASYAWLIICEWPCSWGCDPELVPHLDELIIGDIHHRCDACGADLWLDSRRRCALAFGDPALSTMPHFHAGMAGKHNICEPCFQSGRAIFSRAAL